MKPTSKNCQNGVVVESGRDRLKTLVNDERGCKQFLRATVRMSRWYGGKSEK